VGTLSSRGSVIVVNDPEYDPQGDVLEFRLTYQGPLHGSFNNRPRADEKHTIRKILHPQLRRLWEVTPHLKAMRFPPFEPIVVNNPPHISRIEYLAKQNTRLGGRFVPLVAEDLSLWCGIEILFLRPGIPGEVYAKGDLDNRIKTLFDALKMPKQMQELGDLPFPDNDEDPFFCLLEDDGLVSKLSVEADTLLEALDGGIPSPSDARVVITVRLRPFVFNWENMGFV